MKNCSDEDTAEEFCWDPGQESPVGDEYIALMRRNNGIELLKEALIARTYQEKLELGLYDLFTSLRVRASHSYDQYINHTVKISHLLK